MSCDAQSQSINDGSSVTVSVIQAKGGFSGYDGRPIYRTMAAKLSGAGAKDLRLTGVSSSRFHRMACFDATITFTAADGEKTYWRLRTLMGRKAMLQVQAQVFARQTDEQVRARVDRAFLHAARSLTTS